MASPGYLDRRGTPRTSNDLSAHEIIAFESLDATNAWHFGPNGKLVSVAPRLTVNSADAAIAAAEGLGISRTLPYHVMASVLASRLVRVQISFIAEKLPVSAIYPARRIASTNLGALIKEARDYFKDDPLVPIEEWNIRASSDLATYL